MSIKNSKKLALVTAAIITALTFSSCSSSTVLKPGSEENKTIDVSSIPSITITEIPVYSLTERDNWTVVDDETYVSATNMENGCSFSAINNFLPEAAEEGWGDAFLSQQHAYANRPSLTNHALIQVSSTGVAEQLTFFSGHVDEVAYMEGDEEVKQYGFTAYHAFADGVFPSDYAPENSNVVSTIEFVCPDGKDATIEEWENSLKTLEVTVR